MNKFVLYYFQPVIYLNSIKIILQKRTLPSIYTCILLDLIGLTSYLLPIIGETEDLLWAPLSGIIFFFLFGKKRWALFGGVFSFLEEITPGLDFIPTFTIAWFIRKQEIVSNNVQIKPSSQNP
jgi:hypothetical protein